jgi:non-ribosomal peptide synthase protein (TIGR01720 family)
VIHHLAVDGVSWRILLEDIELLLGALTNGQKTNLGQKSSSYRQWYDALSKYGQSRRLLSQTRYWQKLVESHDLLIVDKDYDGEIKIKDLANHTTRLSSEETGRLIHEVPRVYHTEINDILLSALAKTLYEWSNTDKVIIGLEGHGREMIAEGIDTSRTVGWFTTIYPVLLNAGAEKVEDLIKSVKEQLRQVPDRGLGYGVLRYINKEEALQGRDCWDIVFNYLGQLDNVVRESKWLSAAEESTGAGRGEEYVVREKISVTGLIQGGELILKWIYSSHHYEQETIRMLAEEFISNLEILIAHCTDQQRNIVVYTPSDYGLGSDVTYEELDGFLNERI